MKNEKTYIPVSYLDNGKLYTAVNFQSSPFDIFIPFSNPSILSKIILIQRLLFGLSECTYQDYSIDNIKKHVSIIKNELFNFKDLGFIPTHAVQTNTVFNTFRSVFPELENLMNDESDPIFRLFIIQHLTNITLLLLHLEYKLAIQKYKACVCSETETETESLKDFELDMKEILALITPGIRSELTRRRLSFYNKIYSGYDTEFITKEVRSVEILCYTLASYSRTYVRYIPLNLNFSTDAESESASLPVPPIIDDVMTFLVRVYRELDEKPDDEIEQFIKQLDILVDSKEIEREKTDDGFVYSRARDLSSLYKKFITHYDENVTEYSLKILVEKSIELVRKNLQEEYQFFIGLFKTFLKATESNRYKVKNSFLHGLRSNIKMSVNDKTIIIPTKLDITLISHYSPADICTLTDFDKYKESMTLVKKTFITLSKPLRISDIDVHLRDTSLLTVGNSASLAALGSLYADDGLEKVQIDKK